MLKFKPNTKKMPKNESKMTPSAARFLLGRIIEEGLEHDTNAIKIVEKVLSELETIQIQFEKLTKHMTKVAVIEAPFVRGCYFLEVGIFKGTYLCKPAGKTSNLALRMQQHARAYPESKVTMTFETTNEGVFESILLSLLAKNESPRLSNSKIGELFQVVGEFSMDYYYKMWEMTKVLYANIGLDALVLSPRSSTVNSDDLQKDTLDAELKILELQVSKLQKRIKEKKRQKEEDKVNKSATANGVVIVRREKRCRLF